MRERTAKRLAWLLWAIAMAITVLGLLFLFRTRSTPIAERWGFRGFESFFAVACATTGAIVASRRPRNPIGWLLCGLGVQSGAQLLSEEYAVYALLAHPGSLPVGMALAWIQQWIWLLAVGPFGTFLFLLFPDGRLLSPRWRPAAWLAALAIPAAIFGIAGTPGPLQNFPEFNNPLAIPARVVEPILALGFSLLLLAMLLSVASLALRFVRAQGDERQQLKWVAYTAIPVPITLGVSFVLNYFRVRGAVSELADLLVILFLGAMIAAVGIAILKYRLYDINLIINRTLVYVPLTAILAGLYSASITLSTRAFAALTGEKSDAAIVLTTLVVASAFTPLKNSLQGLVDRRLKEVRDSTKELRAFGEQVRSFIQLSDAEQIARRVLDEAARAFDAQSGAVYFGEGKRLRLVHSFGDRRDEPKLNAALESADGQYGLVSLGARRNGSDYTAKDRELFQQIVDLVAKAIRLAGGPE